MRPLETWIRESVLLEKVSSACLRYDAMDHQAPQGLAGVYRPFDPGQIYDWVDLTLVFAYLDALGTRGRILDVGTGDGWPALPLAPFVQEVVGIDLSPRRIEVACENRNRLGYANARFVVGDARTLPFAEGSFDGVVVGTALEQTDDPDAALSEIRRVLVPKGTLVATFEHLAAELPAGAEEEVELFQKGTSFIYRYVAKEASPPREAEYELTLDPPPTLQEQLELAAGTFPRRPGFVRHAGEPGARALAGDVASTFGLEFLEQVQAAISAGRYFEVGHVDLSSLEDSLRRAGFGEIAVCGRVTRAAHPFFIGLAEAGVLKTRLAPHFETTCAAFAALWPLISPAEDRVLFVRAQRTG